MPVSEAKKRANDKYIKNHYKRYSIGIPNDEAEQIEKYCSDNNISKNNFFREAAKEKINHE